MALPDYSNDYDLLFNLKEVFGGGVRCKTLNTHILLTFIRKIGGFWAFNSASRIEQYRVDDIAWFWDTASSSISTESLTHVA